MAFIVNSISITYFTTTGHSICTGSPIFINNSLMAAALQAINYFPSSVQTQLKTCLAYTGLVFYVAGIASTNKRAVTCG